MDDQPVRRTRKSGIGKFFWIDREKWAKVCELGINPAIAYLVLARGSGRNNRHTAWSVNAIEKHTGISRGRAKKAIKVLCESGMVRKINGGTQPRYNLLSEEKRGETYKIWLPNTIIDGAGREIPPVELIRQTQDVRNLEFFVDLYHAQILREDGGISREFMYQEFDRLKIDERGKFLVWGFRPSSKVANFQGPIEKYLSGDSEGTNDQKSEEESSRIKLRDRIETLLSLGLIGIAPHLFESENLDAEIIHPYGTGESSPHENRIGDLAHRAARQMINGNQYKKAKKEMSGDPLLAPVFRHIREVKMVGIFRLRYLPLTKLTAAWWGESNSQVEGYIEAYEELIKEFEK